ncbi:carboxypeptidase-like regulatory domain-containing protein [uncultured Flavobacterium sp.]|uniref:carboxypeptidase-like regulatory domain-containing protein n=1 Tax=uncultured Flavobacterium sp. TaxID=165435 RepID=UPI0025EB5C31|nr:carboxypeptidase-like regulatory domain-containing protein [uncultured Flavobacterium sp.]
MKNVIKLLMFVVFPLISYSQNIEGKVVDSLQKPIQYVSIGILNKPFGTVTDENGNFKFSMTDGIPESDTLRVSCMGYKSKDILFKNLNQNKINVQLESHIEKLDEVVINKNGLKEYTDGKDKTQTKHSVIFANPNYKNINLGSEIGKKFSLGDKKPSFLTDFKFFIKDNNFEMVKFKINIYNIKDNRPDKMINQSNIIVEVNKKLTDWVNVDLSQFDITVQEDIIITVQWIEHSPDGNKLNLPIIIPSFGSTHYYKFGSQGKWEKYGKISSSMLLSYKQ